MPTTITGQNGLQVKQTTKIAPKGCGVQITGQKVTGNTAQLTVKTFEAGRVSGSGSNLSTVHRHFNGAESGTSLKVPLSPHGSTKGRPLKVKVRVGLPPQEEGRRDLHGLHHRRIQVARLRRVNAPGPEPLPGAARRG